MSGFTRPSAVGPRELKLSTPPPSATAPTVSAPRASPGSESELVGTARPPPTPPDAHSQKRCAGFRGDAGSCTTTA